MSEHTSQTNGRLIVGLRSPLHASLGEPPQPLWDEETNATYMEQSRERAREKARQILAEALEEASLIRDEARVQGFEEGRLEAQGIVYQEHDRLAAFTAELGTALEEERQRVSTAHRATMLELLQLAFEKTQSIILDSQRQQVLENLFTEALQALEERRSPLTIFVGPDDEALMHTVLAAAQEKNPNLHQVRILTDNALLAGGVRLESGSSLVENSIATRLEQVRQALHIPEPDHD